MKYASIDIGSNAVRLLLCNVLEESGETHFKKSELVRIPLRLGEEVFLTGKISEKKSEQFVKTMHAFKLLIEVFDPVDYRACATASMREAGNSSEIIKQVEKDCRLKIEVISGREEAEIIFSNHIEEHLDPKNSYLYIDVGGGSTELTLFSGNKCIVSQSFNIGTIRWMHNKVSKEQWNDFKDWIKINIRRTEPLIAIGSGGNINKIFKMLLRKDGKPLTYDMLKEFYDTMKTHSVEERMEIWGLNPDRADVIVPAAKIFLGIMKSANIDELLVPQIGLSDGIVHLLHEKQLLRV